MSDHSDQEHDAGESLRSLAAWLDLGPEPDMDDRPAVMARWAAIERAAETLGEMAGWDARLLSQAVGPVLDDDDDDPPGRGLLVVAKIRAQQMLQPIGVTAQRLAHSALLGALVIANQDAASERSETVRGAVSAGADLREGWVATLAGVTSVDPLAALELAQEAVEVAALVEERPQHEVDLARSLLSDAEAACRGHRP